MGSWIFSRRACAVRLYLFDLPIQQRKALKTALDLAPQVRRQHPAIARAHAVQLGSPVSAFQCLQMLNPVQSQQFRCEK
jgi:hypothetical protein